MDPASCQWVAVSWSCGKEISQGVCGTTQWENPDSGQPSLQKITKVSWRLRGLNLLPSPHRAEQLLAILPKDPETPRFFCILPSPQWNELLGFYNTAFSLGPQESWERAISVPNGKSLNALNKSTTRKRLLGNTLLGNDSMWRNNDLFALTDWRIWAVRT